MSTVIQNVNLYLPEFRRKKSWLDAEKTVLLAGAGILALALASAVEYWQVERLRSQLAAKEQEQQQAAAATAALLAQYGTQTEDPALLANIRELEEDLQSKQALLQFLEGRELGNAEGFSEYLADLSRYHVQGLSLNHITLSDGGRSVQLAGEVLKPELPPIFIQELARGTAYTGMQFESLQIDDVPAPTGAGATAGNAMNVASWSVRSLKQ